ncbi:MAG: 1-acyl-sn-glycerol-3-phosphate acyltransferase [Dehalococcoidia bacterium]|nr:MAG: 1-acyl-sn-glycerol-3-phosphate acyltransferase [Dehalococcoidia bacterium]
MLISYWCGSKVLPGFYYVCRLVIKMLLLLLTHWQVRGKGNVPGRGPLLIVANHINLADPVLIGASLRRKVTFMAKEELFRAPFSRFFMCNFGAFPVRRGRIDRKAFNQANQVLAEGRVLVVFPEGRRSQNNQLQTAFLGSALIALRNGALVLPVGISGSEKIKGLAWMLRRPRVMVNIGNPFYPPSGSGRLTREELAELTDSMMSHIAELLPPEYRGDYAGRGN